MKSSTAMIAKIGLALLFVRTMTLKTGPREDRPNLAIKVDGSFATSDTDLGRQANGHYQQGTQQREAVASPGNPVKSMASVEYR